MTESSALVLVVDDNEQNRALVQATLEEEGQRVLLACDGEQGLALFDQHAPDCVLLDVRMPKMDGLTVCREIRKRPRGADTPVVFLTAVRDVETFDQALTAGGDDFLTKPVRPTELLVRVQAALKLRRLTEENRDYYQTIRSQRDALIRLQLQTEQLMAFVVHDLKNPVSTIDLHAQLLLRDKSLSTSSQDAARAIREEATLLNRQITSLLDLSKGEEAPLSAAPSSVPLDALVDEVRKTFELRARTKEIRLETHDSGVSVMADRELLRRVLENLLDNAIRHAPHASIVTLHVEGAADTVCVGVADRGMGVPAHLRQRVFERFVQAGEGPAVKGSYGLGLAFCKLAVEHMGGSIRIEDGRPGALFVVSLHRG